jgi:hypothetical protein
MKCGKSVIDLEHVEEHQLITHQHVYRCRIKQLQEHEKTYDGFIELMNRAIEQWGNPEYCNEWSHEMTGTCINCIDNNIIVIGDCSMYSCTGCQYGLWNYLYTYLIDITDWYEVIEDNVSMCRSDIICKKPYTEEGLVLAFCCKDQATHWCDTLLFTKIKPHNIEGKTCVDCGYTEGDDQCNYCDGELCDFCGKCLDCDDCNHCLDCNGEFCKDCGECIECSIKPCQKCCEHAWSEWTVQSHDENGHTQSRLCSKCDVEDIKAESHTRSLSSTSWDWNVWDWVSVTQIKTLEDLLNTTITLDEDSCQYRHRKCVVCDYLEYEIEDHKYNDDWDMRNFRVVRNENTGVWEEIFVEPYYVYSPNHDLVLGSGDNLGNSSMCFRHRSCTNLKSTWNCPRFFDEPEPHTFKLYDECNVWEMFYGRKRDHYFRNAGEFRVFESLSEIGNFDEIIIWLNNNNSIVYCSAGWCSRCAMSRNNVAVAPKTLSWHEWEGMCRRAIVCQDNSVFDLTSMSKRIIDICNDILYEETKPHNIVDNICIDCGYTVDKNICTDIGCIDPNCTLHGNNNHEKCYFCGGNEQCSQCGNCSSCYKCRHCIDCNDRVWHHFEQYDLELGEHWSIVPELIGDGTWEDIIEWLSNEQNFINCFGAKCNKCTTGQGKKIAPIIKNWHEWIYSNGFSACYRAISCSDCGDDVFVEAKVHNFVGNTCIGCGAMKE